jgi:hypothetical protein
MAKEKCKKGACEMVRDDKSIYHPDWKSASGKGDQPRNTTKAYEENYESIFPNAFKPKWQLEVEERKENDAKDTT